MMRKIGLIAVLTALAALTATAEDDPPTRVARLSYLQGSVSFRPGSVEEWALATLNYPLTTGDHLWTDAGARVEMHIGSTAIRMDSETAVSYLTLDDRLVQLSVTQGTVQVRLRELAQDESFEVATPNVAITLLRAGEYLITADGESNTTTVTVRSGDADVTGGGLAFPVHSGQSARVAGLDELTQEVFAAGPRTEFEDWCLTRDIRDEESESARYVPREMTGYEDLDDNGVWRQEADYGWIWAPRTVPIGWAPYRFGHWVWVHPWGWTWVDDQPWGFAPFHYGRWVIVAGHWVWVPGSIRGVRPVYAPALVVFLGGPRFGQTRASFAAWFPLGPREPYRPVYRTSQSYLARLNRGHAGDPRGGRYRNQTVPNAVTAVAHGDFIAGHSVHRMAVSVNPREIERAPVQGGGPALVPGRDSVFGEAGRRKAPPSRVEQRAVVVKHAPAAAPVSMRTQQAAIEANHGRPLDASQEDALRRTAPVRGPVVRIAPPPRPVAPATSRRAVPAEELRPSGETRDASPRTERPRATPSNPAPVYVPPVTQTETPRAERPRQVEQPRIQVPRQVEQPRVQAPRQIEQPRVERPRPVEQPRQVEQPRPVEQRSEPRSVARPSNEERRAERAPAQHVEKPAEKPAETQKSDAPARGTRKQ